MWQVFQGLLFRTFLLRLMLTGIVMMRTGDSEGSCWSEVREKHLGREVELSSCLEARWLVSRHWLRLKKNIKDNDWPAQLVSQSLTWCWCWRTKVAGC